jgi:amino acid adenylation domain-containing protein
MFNLGFKTREKDMNMDVFSSFSFDIPKITAERVDATAGEDVHEPAILLAAIAVLVYRYTGCEKIKLDVKTADSSATIEIDAAYAALTVNQLLIQSHLKLQEMLNNCLCGMSNITIELTGDVIRPVMRSIRESADAGAVIQVQFKSAQNAENKSICKFVYSGKHYADALIQQMARHFKNILSNIIERPDVHIKDIRMLDPEEEKTILERGAGPDVEIGNKCAHHLFEEQASKNPCATALICGTQSMSFGELNSRANNIGHHLKSLGVGSGAVVGIGLERSIEAIVCIMAIFKAGAAYAIVDPEYPTVRINEMLSDAQIFTLITKSSLRNRFVHEGLRVLDYDQFIDCPKENTANVVLDVSADDAAYITFTSGSTGKPKGITGKHLSITTLLLYYRKFFYEENAPGEAGCLLSPLSFGASVVGIFMPLCSGVPLVIIPYGEEKDPYKFACRISEHKVTAFILTTALARQLCNLNDESKKLLQSVKHAGITGSEVTPDLLQAVKRIMPGITITAGYACSEIGGAAFDRLIEDADLQEKERIPIGRPSPNMRSYLLDCDMNIVPAGVPGELYLAAPYLSLGYIGRPDLTENRFLTNPFTDAPGFNRMYRTGDMLRRRFDGEVEYIGRVDSEVKIRGYRIETGEIESVLRNHKEIIEAVVTMDKGKHTERLVAWIVREPEAEADIPELRWHIKKYLPAYMVPSVFIFTKQLPLNTNGKIDRMALSFDAVEYAAETGSYEGPGSQLESTLIELWESILEQEKIGIHDDFVDLGGDSIQAGLLSLEIRDRFNVEILVVMFFEGMTVKTLADEIYHIHEYSD